MAKFLVCAFAASLLCAVAAAQKSGGSVQKQLQAIFAEATAPNAPGLAVLVKKDGKVVFERGYGVRELRSRGRINTQTNFRLASVTKQFTAMAVMLLVHDKKLTYDTKLTEIFPNFPAYGAHITVRHLLNHTSGIPDYEDLMTAEEKAQGKNLWSPEKQIHDDEVLALLEKTAAPKFAAGTKWDYSNSGYVVLGLIVAKVSGKPYEDFLSERIFVPLKMDRTLVFVKRKDEVAYRAFGHSKREIDNTFLETDQSSTSATLGDGGVYSNLEDLSKWDDALRGHTLLSAAEFQAAITPASYGEKATLPDDAPAALRAHPAVDYGFGWFLDPYTDHAGKVHPRMWHYGETMGFKTAVQRFTADNLTIIVLANRTDIDPGERATKAAEVLFEKP